MSNLFYVGINPRYQSFSWLPKGMNIMLSAAGFWNGDEWRKKHHYPRRTGSRWLDSGGFTMLNKYGDYPFSVINFMNFVAWLKPDYYASMDYPCEPNISRHLSLMSNQDRIKATVKNAVDMAEWETHVSGQMVPVIQGYSLDEYLFCIDLYHERGMIRDYMAVGSMCRRISNAELHKLIPEIYKQATQAGATKLHYFGLKLSRDLMDLSEFIHSRDSAVALDSYSPELRRNRHGRRWPQGPREKRLAFESFFRRINQMGLDYISSISKAKKV